jgi:hypothetical protein
MTLAGKTDQKGGRDPKRLASGVFKALGVSDDKKLTKEEFMTGYSSAHVLFSNR